MVYLIRPIYRATGKRSSSLFPVGYNTANVGQRLSPLNISVGLGMEIFKIGLAEFLRRLRRSAALNQDQAAEAINLTRSSISRLENGGRDVSIEDLFLLATGYGVPLSYGIAYALVLFRLSGNQLSPEDARILEMMSGELAREGHEVPSVGDSSGR